MDALYQNALLYAIGWAILHSFWQMALIWMTFQVLFGFRKSSGPDLRYIGAVALLGTGGLLFILTGLYEYQRAMAMGPMLRELSTIAANSDGGAGMLSLADRLSSTLERFMPYLSSAYLIVLFFLAARLWSAWLQTRDIRRNGLTPLDEPWTEEVRNMARQLGLGHVGIFLSDRVQVPVTLGHLRPLILLPVAALNYLTVDQARAVLLHEIAHIRRKDYLVNIGVSVIGTLLFFNPFVHALSASLRRDREMCCDDFVLQCRQDAGDYARALMSLEQYRTGLSPAMVMAATGTKGQLLNRVKRILDVNNGRAAYGQRLFAFLFLAVMLSTLAWMAPDALKGPGMEHQVVKNNTVSYGPTVESLVAEYRTAEANQPALSGVLKPDAEASSRRKDIEHVPARPAELAPTDFLAGSQADLHDAPLSRLDASPRESFEPLGVPGFQEKAMIFDRLASGAPFMAFSPAQQPVPEKAEAPQMLFLSEDGQDMVDALTDRELKIEMEKNFKQLKNILPDLKYLDKKTAIMKQVQQQLFDMRREKNNKIYKDWQKQLVEFQEMDRALQKGMRPSSDLFEEVPASDPESPERVMNIRNEYNFSWSGNDRPEKTVKVRASRPAAGVRYKTMTTTVNVGTPALPGNGIVTIAEPPANLAETPTPMVRVIRGVRVPGTAEKKGVRIIVVEQEPRNIEIRLEQE